MGWQRWIQAIAVLLIIPFAVPAGTPSGTPLAEIPAAGPAGSMLPIKCSPIEGPIPAADTLPQWFGVSFSFELDCQMVLNPGTRFNTETAVIPGVRLKFVF